jgi:hypothetical protein
MAAHDRSSAQAQCDIARAAESLGDAWAIPKPATQACEAWRESVSASAPSTSGAAVCGNSAGRDRVAAKLKACR